MTHIIPSTGPLFVITGRSAVSHLTINKTVNTGHPDRSTRNPAKLINLLPSSWMLNLAQF